MTRVYINVGGKRRWFQTCGWRPGKKFIGLADSVRIRFDRSSGEGLPGWGRIAVRVTETAIEARELNRAGKTWSLPHDQWSLRLLDFTGRGVRAINFFDAVAGYGSFASVSGREEVAAADFAARLRAFYGSKEETLPYFARGVVTKKGVVFDFGEESKGLRQYFWAPGLVKNRGGKRVLLTANKYEGRVMVSGFVEEEGKARVFCEHFFDGWGFYDVLRGGEELPGLRLYHIFTERGYFYFDDVLVVLTSGRTRTDRHFRFYTDRQRRPLYLKGSHSSKFDLHHYFGLEEREKLVACAPVASWSKKHFALVTGEREGLKIIGGKGAVLPIYSGINPPFIVPRERVSDFSPGELVRGRFESGVLVRIYPADPGRPYVELPVRIFSFDGEKFVLTKAIGQNLPQKDYQGIICVTGKPITLSGKRTRQVKISFGGETLSLAVLPHGMELESNKVSSFGSDGELLYYDFCRAFEGRNLEIVLAAAGIIKTGEKGLVRNKQALADLMREKEECFSALLKVGKLREIEEGLLGIFLDEPVSLVPLRAAMDVRRKIFQREILLRKRAIDKEELENIVARGDFGAFARKLVTRGNRDSTFLFKAHLLDVLYGISKESERAAGFLARLPEISSRSLPKILEILSAASDGEKTAAAIRAIYETAKAARKKKPAAAKPKVKPKKTPKAGPKAKPRAKPATTKKPKVRPLPAEWPELVAAQSPRSWGSGLSMARGIRMAISRFKAIQGEIEKWRGNRLDVLNRLASLQAALAHNYEEAMEFCRLRVGLDYEAKYLGYMMDHGITDLARLI